MTTIAVLYHHGAWEKPNRIEFAEFDLANDGVKISDKDMNKWNHLLEEGRQQGYSVGWTHIGSHAEADAEWAYRLACRDLISGDIN